MSEANIVCANNGPYRLSGNFVLQDADGNVFDLNGRETLSLCRCGQSKNKPLCDGSHRGCFDSTLQARQLPPPPPPA